MKAEGRLEPRLRFILFLALFFALWTVRATVLIPIDQSIQSSEARSTCSTLVKVILWLLPALAFTRFSLSKLAAHIAKNILSSMITGRLVGAG